MILHGDCVEKLKALEDNSVDAIVTDPPYGLKFMGKNWDYDVPSISMWVEALRVLKPGGHLLAFGGTRTYHRLVVNIEDAGFEIRDQVMWLYGSGFPKSHNIGKAIDKANGVGPEVIGKGRSGKSYRAYQSEEKTTAGEYQQTKSTNKWSGLGTALKPANEPICLARKPLDKGLTIAENVLKYGTGALNIDESRISGRERTDYGLKNAKRNNSNVYGSDGTSADFDSAQGRWPANVLLDEQAAFDLDEQSGESKGSGKRSTKKQNSMGFHGGETTYDDFSYPDSGGASRFFYVAKASKRERNEGIEGMPEKESGVKNDSGRGFSESDPYKKVLNQNYHPTVKPIKLMEYLIKLVTPKGGTVLDPFAGSGSTCVAAKRLGFKFIGIEREKEYVAIAEKRVRSTKRQLELV